MKRGQAQRGGRAGRPASALALAVLLATPVEAARSARGDDRVVLRDLDAASVSLNGGHCAGVLAERPQIILTAGHCVRGIGEKVQVRFTNGLMRTATVAGVDHGADQAMLVLLSPVGASPLRVRRDAPERGIGLFFEGNPARPRPQKARLTRIGRCPSLPAVPDALFTTIDGKPGDSGAPVADSAGEVVGLVHGGARCHIATPGGSLLRLIARTSRDRALWGSRLGG